MKYFGLNFSWIKLLWNWALVALLSNYNVYEYSLILPPVVWSRNVWHMNVTRHCERLCPSSPPAHCLREFLLDRQGGRTNNLGNMSPTTSFTVSFLFTVKASCICDTFLVPFFPHFFFLFHFSFFHFFPFIFFFIPLIFLSSIVFFLKFMQQWLHVVWRLYLNLNWWLC